MLFMDDGGGCLGSESYGMFPQHIKLSYLKKQKNPDVISHDRWNYEKLWKHIFLSQS